MAGFSGIPALDVNPIGVGTANTAGMLGNMTQLQNYQTQQQLLPAQIADTEAQYAQRSQLRPLELQEAKQKSALEGAEFGNQALAQVARDAQAADPEDAPAVWDEGMKRAAAQGVTQADQYIAHYRPDLAERIADVYGGRTEGATGARANAQAGPMGNPNAVARAVAQMPMPDVKRALGNLNLAISSFNKVKDQASWESEIQTLREAGIAVDNFLPNLDWNPINFAAASRAIRGLVPMRDAMAQRAAAAAMGAPAVSPPPMYEPNYQYVGTEQGTGKPVYHDIQTAQDVTGATPIGPKPSTAMSTFLLKQQAYLQSHPDDQNGALEFANGKRNMSPAQMQESALNQANKELADATLAGAVIPDPDAWVRQKTAANYALISGAGAPQVSNPKAVT